MTLHSTFPNSGTTQEYLRFLMAGAEEKGDAEHYYRCFCKVLHEYQGFAWHDEDEVPHVVESCDGFAEYEPEVEERPAGHRRKMPERRPAQKTTENLVEAHTELK